MTEPALAIDPQDVTWTPTDDGSVVVLDLRTSVYLSLNASAAVLWRLLAEGSDRAALAGELVARYGISADQAERDVAAFVDDLRARNLLRGDS